MVVTLYTYYMAGRRRLWVLEEENRNLREERRVLVSESEAARRLVDDVNGLAVVLYRVVDGARVDTVLIKEVPGK